ncbi:MAG: pyrroline-5-carboxylate reductase [archaeon]
MMKNSIAVIGAGVIGGSVTKSILKSDYEGKITVADIQLEKAKALETMGAALTTDNKKAAKNADVVFLCVKPNLLKPVLQEISNEVEGKLVVSTAAAVTVQFCKRVAPKARIVRIMPNVAISVQESFTAYCCDSDVTEQDKQTVKFLLDLMGKSMEIDEKYMDAVTAVSGSGPGYLSIVVEALAYAGLKVGLPRDLALQSAAQAVLGTAKLVLETGLSPAQIRDNVTTPGGTTIEAIYEVEGSDIRQALVRAVEAATKKSETIRKNWE